MVKTSSTERSPTGIDAVARERQDDEDPHRHGHAADCDEAVEEVGRIQALRPLLYESQRGEDHRDVTAGVDQVGDVR